MADSAIAARRKKDRERKTPGKWARTEAARASAGFFRARPRGALCGAASVACCSFHCPSTSNTVVAAGRTEPAAADSCRVAPLPHRSRVAAEPPSCTNALCTNALSLVAQGFVPRQPSAPARGPLHAEALTRGMIMTPLPQQAHRGVSALSRSTMPSVCSECQQSGEWRDGSPHALICCELCITVTLYTCIVAPHLHSWKRMAGFVMIVI